MALVDRRAAVELLVADRDDERHVAEVLVLLEARAQLGLAEDERDVGRAGGAAAVALRAQRAVRAHPARREAQLGEHPRRVARSWSASPGSM